MATWFFVDYLLGLSDQAEDNNHYTRVKYVKVTEFSSVVVDGKINCQTTAKEPASQMGNEAWGLVT